MEVQREGTNGWWKRRSCDTSTPEACSDLDGSQRVPPLGHKLPQITRTVGSAARESVRRIVASFKGAFRHRRVDQIPIAPGSRANLPLRFFYGRVADDSRSKQAHTGAVTCWM
jgi:hypothetical protein